MRYIKILSIVLFFIELNLLFILLFLTITYILFNGKELSGLGTTIATVLFVLFSLLFSSLITRKFFLYLKNCKNKTVLFIFIVTLAISIVCIAVIKTDTYLLSGDR
jgi:hypothetical protein